MIPGGQLSGPGLRMRWLGLGLAAFTIQAVLIYRLGPVNAPRGWLPVLLPLAHILLVPFLVRNFWSWGVRLIFLGLALNLTAMVANGGLMPVQTPAANAVGTRDVEGLATGRAIAASKNVLLEADEISLRELTDIIVLPLPRPLARAVSPGDLVIFAGVVTAYVEAVRRTVIRGGARVA